MNSKTRTRRPIVCVIFLLFAFCSVVSGYELFIYRPHRVKNPLSTERRIRLHGEFFGQIQSPCTFPSYNDLTGPVDRWNYGFHNVIYLTSSSRLHAQLITHDDGGRRTKFDWHFSFRQHWGDNLVLILGHDSNHDSDYQSTLESKSFYLNRNYIGIGLPFTAGDFYIEPFTRFLHTTNQKSHLDQSGNRLRQEYGIRIGAWFQKTVGLHLQIYSQTEQAFSLGQAYVGDLIIRIKLADYLELAVGGSLWRDIQESRLGLKQSFHKVIWGLAIPF